MLNLKAIQLAAVAPAFVAAVAAAAAPSQDF